MAWYWLTLIIIGGVALLLFALTFIMYITNSDMKMVAKIYDKVIAYHDKKDVEEKI